MDILFEILKVILTIWVLPITASYIIAIITMWLFRKEKPVYLNDVHHYLCDIFDLYWVPVLCFFGPAMCIFVLLYGIFSKIGMTRFGKWICRCSVSMYEWFVELTKRIRVK